jgi:hypothetical protein
MKFLRCIVCNGEVDIISTDRCVSKKIKCRKCGFANYSESKEPEIVIIRKRPIRDNE